MKTSYVKFLRILIAIAYYGLIVSVFIIMSLPVVSSFYPKSAVQVGMKIPIQLRDSASFNENGLTATISSSDHAVLIVNLTDFGAVRRNALLYGAMLLTLVVLVGVLLLLVYQLKQLVSTIGTPAVFSRTNVVRIRIIGGLLIALELISPVMWLAIRPEVLPMLNQYHIRYTGEQIGASTSGLVFAGLLVIGLAEVFRSGYQLKEESELTI